MRSVTEKHVSSPSSDCKQKNSEGSQSENRTSPEENIMKPIEMDADYIAYIQDQDLFSSCE